MNFAFEDKKRNFYIKTIEESNRVLPHLFVVFDAEHKKIRDEIGLVGELVRENASIAGSSVEKTWQKFLQKILPQSNLEILNKVIIQFPDGYRSPEIDLVVVKDMPALADKFYVDVHFVVAAFEVKSNLKCSHLNKIFETSVAINRYRNFGSIKNELNRDIIYGVLASTSSLSDAKVKDDKYHIAYSKREQKTMLQKISEYEWAHPTDLPDFIVVEKYFSLGCKRDINYNEVYPCDFLPDIGVSYYPYLSSGGLNLKDINTEDLFFVGYKNSTLGNFAFNLAKKMFINQHLGYSLVASYEPYSSSMLIPSFGFPITILDEEIKTMLNASDELTSY